MFRTIQHAVLSLLILSASAVAADNPALSALRQADRADRSTGEPDWKVIRERDQERADAVRAEFEHGMVRTANDYQHAAMILQHGEGPEDYRLANALATIAATLEPSPFNRWLSAATFDRLLMSHDEPQWYGTQFVRTEAGGLVLYEVDPDAVDDNDRTRMAVPSLGKSRQRERAAPTGN